MNPHDDPVLGALLRRQASRHAPPVDLAERIQRQVRAEQGAASQQQVRRPAPLWSRWGRALSLYAAGVLSAGLVASVVMLTLPPQAMLAQEVTASHLRSLQADHLLDVPSSDRHTVKPWFAGRLDFSPPVLDLAAQGYPLIGGRVDYLGQRAVAAMVYRHDGHVINLFVWPVPADGATDSGPQPVQERGYRLMRWRVNSMQLWAVSDMGPNELRAFVQAWQRDAATAPISGGER